MNQKIKPTVFTNSKLYVFAIESAIIVDDIEEFKRVLNSPCESLSEDQRYSIAYSICVSTFSKDFLHCLIFEFNLKEDLISPQYMNDDVRTLFAQRKAQELDKELEQKDGREKRIKV